MSFQKNYTLKLNLNATSPNDENEKDAFFNTWKLNPKQKLSVYSIEKKAIYKDVINIDTTSAASYKDLEKLLPNMEVQMIVDGNVEDLTNDTLRILPPTQFLDILFPQRKFMIISKV
jgi:Cu2+-containing amine oxidase